MKPDCHISDRLKACCDTCGSWPDRLHMPEEFHGWYCARCCPVCKTQPTTQPVRPADPPAAGAHQAA